MKTTAAVVQDASVPFDAEAAAARAAARIAEAADRGARLVAFPEAFVGGYPKGANFEIAVGMRTPAGRDAFRRCFDGAIAVPGPVTERLGRAARAARAHVVIGVIEKDGGTLYCTALFFGADGSLLGRHRKLMPTAAERLMWGMGDGSTLPVFDTPAGRLGAVICWENYMPMLRMAMYAKGVTVYCAPTADDRETWLPTMRHIALEGRCFVLSACQAIRRSAFPEGYVAVDDDGGGDNDRWLMRGGSAIVGPLGEVLAGPVWEESAILTAELDFDDLARARFDFDVAGHYARPDVFTLSVDERPRAAVRSAT
ncbi:Bifunctional nitrilase/nitrile hydratase NIT4 [uncultured Alphaproteobacteria bacterium]|uniref:Bifunctional nitrilase/nitrile hydratase NIT4 n=1 Tax=uncultured Alphaproteobacteria bacterium TaxID=91750 RepID=A0A212KM05_9PROT|nr:Bifunctional nitrilase/nitrile hydratase NIT4 [uncultured Alphaproteobacteria bacterium]